MMRDIYSSAIEYPSSPAPVEGSTAEAPVIQQEVALLQQLSPAPQQPVSQAGGGTGFASWLPGDETYESDLGSELGSMRAMTSQRCMTHPAWLWLAQLQVAAAAHSPRILHPKGQRHPVQSPASCGSRCLRLI
jgi:hypothetical protein